MNHDVLLLSGLGPGRLDQEDLIGTCFDKNSSNFSKYIANGRNYSPLNLQITINENKQSLLRRKKKRNNSNSCQYHIRADS